MNHILRGILVNSVGIALASLLLPGIDYGNRLTTLIFAAIVLGIANTFLRPILALILLPINIITLGIAGLFMNTILLFIVTLIVPAFNIVPFALTLGVSTFHFSIIASYVVCSIVLSMVVSILRRIVNP